MNKVELIGRLVADPELKETGTGIPVTSFTLAVDRRTGREEHQTDWIDCVAWRGIAEFICKYFQKGSPIVVEGSIQTRMWEKDGQRHKNVEVKVDDVEFVPRTRDTAGEATTAQNTVPIERGQTYSQKPKEVYGAAQAFSQGGNEDFEQVNDEDLLF